MDGAAVPFAETAKEKQWPCPAARLTFHASFLFFLFHFVLPAVVPVGIISKTAPGIIFSSRGSLFFYCKKVAEVLLILFISIHLGQIQACNTVPQ